MSEKVSAQIAAVRATGDFVAGGIVVKESLLFGWIRHVDAMEKRLALYEEFLQTQRNGLEEVLKN